ncbi:hypothetical protein [Desulfotruncus alcoholivorax]|uniref:hypothetical protein n=1 Tax=Desulfotruncus alcoholivorax TaxID=265477 RepID=UPI0003F5617E|nr:hypothetical protein [Desulfotruncus alcoholivorax]
MTLNQEKSTDVSTSTPETIIQLLASIVEELDRARNNNQPENYCAFLHGQISGIAIALRTLFPGPGNLGEKAALILRPVITEHKCDCHN